jgi:hypothetical protein
MVKIIYRLETEKKEPFWNSFFQLFFRISYNIFIPFLSGFYFAKTLDWWWLILLLIVVFFNLTGEKDDT